MPVMAFSSVEANFIPRSPTSQPSSQNTQASDSDATQRLSNSSKMSEEQVGWPLQALPLPVRSDKYGDDVPSVSERNTLEFGGLGTLGYRMLFLDAEWKEISPWHDIPLFASSGNLNFVCTTPKGCWAEYEFAKDEPFTPVKLASKSGMPLHYAENLKWNYGFLPQTWCSSSLRGGVELGRLPFDDSPLYVFDLSSRNSKTGDVYPVKPIAAYAVREPGPRISWKILSVDVTDPMASASNLTELVTRFPGIQDTLRSWLKTCRCIQPGDIENELIFDGYPVSREQTHDVVAQMHAAWKTYDYKASVPDNFPTGPRPIKATKYECAWAKYTTHTTDVSIPLSDSNAGSSLQYDRAWANTEDENANGSRRSSSGDPSKKVGLPNGVKKQLKNMFNPTPNPKLRPRHKKNFSGELHTLIRGVPKKSDHSVVSFLPADGKALPPTCIYRSYSGESSELAASANSARRWKSFDLTLASLEALNSMIETSTSPSSTSSVLASPVSSLSPQAELPKPSSSIPDVSHKRTQSYLREDVLVSEFSTLANNSLDSTGSSIGTLLEVDEDSASTSSSHPDEPKPEGFSRASFIANMRVNINVKSSELIQTEYELVDSSSESACSPFAQASKFFPESPMTPTMYNGYLSKPDSPAMNLPAGFGTKLRRWASLDAQFLNMIKEPNSPVMTPRTLRKYRLVKGRGFVQRSSSTECSPRWDDEWLSPATELKSPTPTGMGLSDFSNPSEVKFHNVTAMLTSRTISA